MAKTPVILNKTTPAILSPYSYQVKPAGYKAGSTQVIFEGSPRPTAFTKGTNPKTGDVRHYVYFMVGEQQEWMPIPAALYAQAQDPEFTLSIDTAPEPTAEPTAEPTPEPTPEPAKPKSRKRKEAAAA